MPNHFTLYSTLVNRLPQRRLSWAVLLLSLSLGPLQGVELTVDDIIQHTPEEVNERLERARPPVLTRVDTLRIMATLPTDGRVLRLNAAEQRKLARAREALAPFKRADVYELMVIDIPQAGVWLHARAVVLISKPALDLIDADELAAVVAHEAAHDYLWSDLESARAQADTRALQQLELVVDAIAILQMRGTGLSYTALTRPLKRITSFNERFGIAVDHNRYPPLQLRLENARRVAAWLKNHASETKVRHLLRPVSFPSPALFPRPFTGQDAPALTS